MQKANGASKHEVAELKRDKEESDEREQLKKEIKREIQQGKRASEEEDDEGQTRDARLSAQAKRYLVYFYFCRIFFINNKFVFYIIYYFISITLCIINPSVGGGL